MHESELPRKTVPAATSTALPLAALMGGNVALAFGPWFVRMADVGPVAAAFWRVTLAVPVLIAICFLIERRPFASAKGLGWVLALAGVAFAVDLGAWHLGIVRTTLANSTLFGNSATLMFPIYGFLVAKAWPNRSQAVALALAAAGAVLLLGQSYQLSAKHLFGDLLCLLAGAFYTLYFVLMLRARERVAPLPALALASTACTLPLLLFALGLGESVLPQQWGPLIALALASQVLGQGLTIYALGHLPPLVVGIGLLSQPIVGAAIGWIAYGERLGPWELFGAALVAAALVLVRREG